MHDRMPRNSNVLSNNRGHLGVFRCKLRVEFILARVGDLPLCLLTIDGKWCQEMRCEVQKSWTCILTYLRMNTRYGASAYGAVLRGTWRKKIGRHLPNCQFLNALYHHHRKTGQVRKGSSVRVKCSKNASGSPEGNYQLRVYSSDLAWILAVSFQNC